MKLIARIFNDVTQTERDVTIDVIPADAIRASAGEWDMFETFENETIEDVWSAA